MSLTLPFNVLVKKTISRNLRKIGLLTKYYKVGFLSKEVKSGIVMFYSDKFGISYPGLVDRLKSIVGVYAYAKTNGYNFYLVHNSSFEMEKYLKPNLVKWNIDASEITNNLCGMRFFDYLPYKRMPRKLEKNIQYHCYFFHGSNFQSELQDCSVWKDLFDELFLPSEHLERLLDKQVVPQEYISVHIRFVNSLGSFEKDSRQVLEKSEQEKLIDKCLCALQKIKDSRKETVLVFSDSSKFLAIAEKNGFDVLSTENIGHVSFANDENTYDKVFIDLFTMSRSKSVVSIRGEYLYNSAFPQYAAIIGGISYDIYNI